MILVSDASPLIALAAVGHFDVLRSLYDEVLIPQAVYDEVVGVTKFGVFVQMKALLTEGLVHVRDMGNDYWEYDPRNYALVGSNTNQTIRLGDEVRVQIASASVEARRIDLLFVG